MEARFECEIDKIETGVLLQDISFTYDLGLPQETKALSNINLEVRAGQHVAVLGHNGSGKSTLAHLINAYYSKEQYCYLVVNPLTMAIWEIRCRSVVFRIQ